MTKIPKSNYSFVDHVPEKFDDALLCISDYRYYLNDLYAKRVHAKSVKDSTTVENDKEEMKLAYKKIPKESAEFYGAIHTYYKFKTEKIEELEVRLKEFTTRYPKSEYSKFLQGKLDFKKYFSAGKPAPDFLITTIDGVNKKLSELKGKVVYLDFWATWCGPCMDEVPSLKKLKEAYTGKDIVFVCVSLDADDDAWRKMIVQKGMTGLHMRDGAGGWEGPVTKSYNVRSIPTAYLIDKNGNFAMDKTPNLHDIGELKKAIDNLLEGKPAK